MRSVEGRLCSLGIAISSAGRGLIHVLVADQSLEDPLSGRIPRPGLDLDCQFETRHAFEILKGSAKPQGP